MSHLDDKHKPRLIDIQNIYDSTGSIGVVEASKHLGFSIKRLYFLHGIKAGVTRGSHAHKDLHQCIVAVSGSLTIALEGKGKKHLFTLNDPSKALFLPPGYWRTLSDFSENAVCAVLASREHDEKDYIRNYDAFLDYEKSNEIVTEVPFLDFKRCYQDINFALAAAYEKVMMSGNYICGNELLNFEESFAKTCDAKYCVGVSNGLDAISLTMEAWGINKPHMEVICATNSFVATALGVSRAGAKPILVEPDESTYNISISAIEKAITNNTKAIALTHLYGQPADMDAINSIATKYSLKVLEDSAQAHLAEYKGRKCGSLGDAACFSFYPTKNLGGFGDGGAITTNEKVLADKLRKLRNYGSIKKYYHEELGTNARLDELQAALLNVKLQKLPQWTEHKRLLAEIYLQELKDIEFIVLPFTPKWANPVWHVFPIRVLNGNRRKLIEHLDKYKVGYNVHYPVPIHLQKCYEFLGYKKGDFPFSEQSADELLSLPIDSYHTEKEVRFVVNIIKLFAAEHVHNSSKNLFYKESMTDICS